MSTISESKDIIVRKSEFLTQFLFDYQIKVSSVPLYLGQSYLCHGGSLRTTPKVTLKGKKYLHILKKRSVTIIFNFWKESADTGIRIG